MKINEPQKVMDAAQALAGARAMVRKRRRALIEAAQELDALNTVTLEVVDWEDAPVEARALVDDLVQQATGELRARVLNLIESTSNLEKRRKAWEVLR